MSETKVVLFAEGDGTAPLLEWLEGLPSKAQDKCLVRIERLRKEGNQLRRPEADYLRDGIYELRVSLQGIQYRMLYFFHDTAAVLTHGFIKRAERVPEREIELAVKRRIRFFAAPDRCTYKEIMP